MSDIAERLRAERLEKEAQGFIYIPANIAYFIGGHGYIHKEDLLDFKRLLDSLEED